MTTDAGIDPMVHDLDSLAIAAREALYRGDLEHFRHKSDEWKALARELSARLRPDHRCTRRRRQTVRGTGGHPMTTHDTLVANVITAMSHNDTGFRNYKGYEGMAKAAIAVCLTHPSPVTIERELRRTISTWEAQHRTNYINGAESELIDHLLDTVVELVEGKIE